MTTASDSSRHHALAIGARLRRVRHQQGMSLADVQEASGGRWKSVVVGAYERGDRAITVGRLSELASFYQVPLVDLLPDPTAAEQVQVARSTLDLQRLDAAPATQGLAAIARFAEHIRRRRGDHNGLVLTLRAGDLETVALAVDETSGALREELERHGALRSTGRGLDVDVVDVRTADERRADQARADDHERDEQHAQATSQR